MTVPFAIPASWSWGKLSDVVSRIEAGKSFTCHPRRARADEWGVIKVSAMTWGEFREQENKAVPTDRDIDPRHEIRPGDLLISRANTEQYVGAPVLVQNCRPQLLLSDKSLRLVPAEDVDPRWLLAALASPFVRRQISSRASGQQDSMRNISQGALLGIDLPIPPLAEQYRIVDFLEDALAALGRGIDALAAAEVKVQALDRHLRSHAVGGGRSLGETIPMRLHDVADARTPVLGGYLPDGWSVATLGSISSDWGYGTSAKCSYEASGVPVLRIPNVQNGEISLSDVKYSVDVAQSLDGFFVNSGDLLFVRTNGSPRLIGRVAVVRQDMPVAFASYLIRFRLKPGVVDPDWVAFVVSSPAWRRHIEKAAASSAGQYNLNSKILARLPIPMPPLNEQRALLSSMAETRTLINGVDRELIAARRRAAALRASLLAEAFAGRLVPQDPDDEPASDLLARIRADREAALPMQKARSRRTKKDLPAPPTRVTGDDYQQEALPL
ncbi:restriction endonuclease subunit S [Micromonospora endophytica]|uniref:Type I restriction modification DNA specificity domain-containing protein n=1 Tax=Micromonospora endophytica TaxID=515350 RepID=A0A2W2CNY3_9ACTN|nr:restriction endonuclease subunit S [Micromonospora endophytica]PZF90079.1 hypothetical protein C1I93_23225 [Micromonospora endophytica]RIW41602.1 hypothetical protein D3H59_25685 [Micromonospora endophytica]